MYENDKRIVLTLDAGGTNFVFNAIQGCQEILDPVWLPSITDNLENCLAQIVKGFEIVMSKLDTNPDAISFAFPGPADYEAGIIGDLPNFKCFRSGVALGPFLKQKFKLPVFINNDGNLFAYGESAAGFLPYVNSLLEKVGNPKRYKNIIGVTIGTGFGAGVVINGNLLTGDNGCGGDVWLMDNKKYPGVICEESVSARAVPRVYKELTGELVETPKEVYDIAEGQRQGNKDAAIKSFEELGETAAHAIRHALDIVDGLVVVGGGVAAASKYIIPAIIKELNSTCSSLTGTSFSNLQMKVFDIDKIEGQKEFLSYKDNMIKVPYSDIEVRFDLDKKTAIGVTKLGTSRAVGIGAYAIALSKLDSIRQL